jgi:TRAP-type C4-dicarboxylate transport system permease small subunit
LPENSVTTSSPDQEAPWERAIARVSRVLSYIGMVFVILMMLLTVAHGIGRYAFEAPIKGLVEMSQFMLVLVIFCLMPYTETKKNHLIIGILVDRLPQRAQAIMSSIMYIFSLLVLGIATYRAFERGLFQIAAGQTSMFLRIPHWPFFFVVCICWLLLMLAIAVNLVHFLRAARRGTG